MTKNLDLEIRKALNSKIEVEKFMLFTVNHDDLLYLE